MNTHSLPEAARKWAPRLVLGSYLALALAFNVVTPPFENSDEPWHYAYVKFVADGLARAWKFGPRRPLRPPRGRRDEYRTLYPPSRHDHAGHGGHPLLRLHRLSLLARQ